MNDAILIFISILCAFIIGVVLMLWVGRGFLMAFIKSFRGGYLLRIHREDGMSAYFKCGKVGRHGLIEYKDEDGETKVISFSNGCVKRCARTWLIDVPYNSTAPYDYRRVIPFTEKVKLENGEERERIVFSAFEGYSDSSIIKNALEWALARPKRDVGSVLGLDIKTIFIILLVVGGAVLLILQLKSGGSGVI
jgi:hypothetical protein